MIEVKHLTFSYGKEPFIEDMNFDVKEGEIFGFLGPSGAGKSTREKIIIGLIPGYQGSVTVGGIESNHLSISSLKADNTQQKRESMKNHLFAAKLNMFLQL